MTIEEITHTLQAVAENHAKLSAEIAEIDRILATLVQTQSRYDAMLTRHDDILHEIADKQLGNEERFTETDKRFAQLAATQLRSEARREQLESSFQLLEQFAREFRNQTNENTLATDKLFSEAEKKLIALVESQAKTDEQINRTGEFFRLLLESNGAAPGSKSKLKKSKKAGKKGSAK